MKASLQFEPSWENRRGRLGRYMFEPRGQQNASVFQRGRKVMLQQEIEWIDDERVLQASVVYINISVNSVTGKQKRYTTYADHCIIFFL